MSKLVLNVHELEDIGNEYDSNRLLVDSMKNKLKHAKRMASQDKQNMYSQLMKECDSLSEFYTKMGTTSKTLSSDGEALIKGYKSELEDNIVNNNKRFG